MPKRARKKRTPIWIFPALIGLLLALIALYYLLPEEKESAPVTTASTSQQTATLASSSSTQEKSSTTTSASEKSSDNDKPAASDLPKGVSSKDWELLLVNREAVTPELHPELATIENITVDARIEQAATDFLAAARKIDASEHAISGYRSVEYQTELYQSYVQQEMAERGISEKEAEKVVQTYSQPPGSSEHQTGLAMDMSTVDALNQSAPATVAALQKIAPDYGFVLRFEKGKKVSTGIDYEDWHWRYVGKENARYMTQHQLSLEEYVALIQQAEE